MPSVGFNNRVLLEFCACGVREGGLVRGEGAGERREEGSREITGFDCIMYDVSTICAAAPEIRLGL